MITTKGKNVFGYNKLIVIVTLNSLQPSFNLKGF